MTVNRKSSRPKPKSESEPVAGLETKVSIPDKEVSVKMSERVAIIAIILAAGLGLIWMWHDRAMLTPPADKQPEITLPQAK